jgi:hypothetical protein
MISLWYNTTYRESEHTVELVLYYRRSGSENFFNPGSKVLCKKGVAKVNMYFFLAAYGFRSTYVVGIACPESHRRKLQKLMGKVPFDFNQ